MNLAIVFGLASAAMYGLCDFVARFANRQAGVLRTMFWGQGFVAAILTFAVLTIRQVPAFDGGDWGLLLLSNIAVLAGTGCLYRGLAVGRVSVVSPIMASYGAIGAILSAATGEKLAAWTAIGLAGTAIGAILSASGGRTATAKTSGWTYAVGAAVLYGLGFWIQGRFVIPRFGPIFGLWIYYIMATVITGAVCLVRRCPFRMQSLKDAGLVVGTATLAGAGYAALAAGQTTGAVAVVTALSAGSTAVTVILATVFLKEKPGVKGWLGVALVAGGVALLDLLR